MIQNRTILTAQYSGWAGLFSLIFFALLAANEVIPNHPGVILALVFGVTVLAQFAVVFPEMKRSRKAAAVSLLEVLAIFAIQQLILRLLGWGYRFIPEYGFQKDAPFYQPWFQVLSWITKIHLVVGMPYIYATRRWMPSPQEDSKDLSVLLAGKMFSTFKSLPLKGIDSDWKQGVLAVLLKAFFLPVMTVFFFDQCPHLIQNFQYMKGLLSDSPYEASRLPQDIHNIGNSFIFSIDLAIAWVGYASASRWLGNTLKSVEPTVLGWTVALLCYPPFRSIMGWYLEYPSENSFLSMSGTVLSGVLAIVSVVLLGIYTWSTVTLGCHFSNLTHRGVSDRGPYRWMRHPAYACKNLSWWVLIFPFSLQAWIRGGDWKRFCFEVLGLMGLTAFYVMRANTEEKHLSLDPAYQEYVQRVPRKFFFY